MMVKAVAVKTRKIAAKKKQAAAKTKNIALKIVKTKTRKKLKTLKSLNELIVYKKLIAIAVSFFILTIISYQLSSHHQHATR